MKNTIIVLCMLGGAASAEPVDQASKVVSAEILNESLPSAEIKKLEGQVSREDLIGQLATSLENAENSVVELAICRMVLSMKPFAFNNIAELLTSQRTNSTKRAYLLFLLNEGASNPEEIAKVVEIAKSILNDKGKGTRRFGEARAYSADGLRVCDIAYNVLVNRLPLNPLMLPVDVDNFVPDKRDALILELAERGSIRLIAEKSSATTNEISPQVPALEHLTAPKKAPEAKPLSAASSDKTASSTSWSTIAVLIVMAFGLLWLVLKKRK